MTTTRTRALDAAVELLGTEGLRSLTHVRVDERAGLPKGSTSNYFRTRRALVEGAADRILEREMPGVGTAFQPTSPEEFVEGLSSLLELLTGPARVPTTARLVLFLEASHDAPLREVLSRGRATLEAMGVAGLATLGARDPRTAAAAVAACFEGLLLHRVARHDDTDPRPVLGLVVRGALA
ncbi:TetR/AcrR family transcriptional regulator [Georgenia muralis]|uniref:TetR family transcriptional regulator n=1 Tax=Georgenia muralis TaxID=154117 RepID=A0A3N4ZA28_9MICO|nr:TetR/AcrR family transcriptional regulator [Georgenia muralis]RPF29107.1 TetR family transcriptional regulator [Georgenia muralis]